MKYFALPPCLRSHYIYIIVVLLCCTYTTSSAGVAEEKLSKADDVVVLLDKSRLDYVLPTSNEVTVLQAVPPPAAGGDGDDEDFSSRSSSPPSQLSELLGARAADLIWNVQPAKLDARTARRTRSYGRGFGIDSGMNVGLDRTWEESEEEGEGMALPWLQPVRTPEPKKIKAYKLVKDSEDAEYVNDSFLTRGVPQMRGEDLRRRGYGTEGDHLRGGGSTGYYGAMLGQRKNNNMYFDEYENMEDLGGEHLKKWKMVSEEEHRRQADRIRQKQLREHNKKYIIGYGYY
eukprot:GHVS01075986.1.p1 GENE.GHVS01075986.1~~GHVS01075986.1.p1  ORF type:complete len:288 (+),score=66.10 GHVS01075986.1:156-1019(+)